MTSGQGSRDSLFFSEHYEKLKRAQEVAVVVDTRSPEEIREQWMTEQIVIEQALLDMATAMGWNEGVVLQNYFINNKAVLTSEDNERFAEHHIERETHGVALSWEAFGERYCVKVDTGKTRNPFVKFQEGVGQADDRVLHEVSSDNHSAENLYLSLNKVAEVYSSMFN
jgi:hypothetical protein